MALMQSIAGAVGADGAIVSGAGFRITKDDKEKGKYLVTFIDPFPVMPAVVVSLYGDAKALDNSIVSDSDTTKATIATVDSKGAIADKPFSFIATAIQYG